MLAEPKRSNAMSITISKERFEPRFPPGCLIGPCGLNAQFLKGKAKAGCDSRGMGTFIRCRSAGTVIN